MNMFAVVATWQIVTHEYLLFLFYIISIIGLTTFLYTANPIGFRFLTLSFCSSTIRLYCSITSSFIGKRNQRLI